MTTEDYLALLQQARADGDYSAVIRAIPYANTIGVQLFEMGSQPTFLLPKNKDNIGNPMLPAIHGGVIGGFMEMSASLHLLLMNETATLPKIIDFSLDYLRAGRHTDTYASCQVWRQGNRVANVAINAWQTDVDQPIATARAHFLMV
ncbi:PaaI family thioesterase [Thalassolituus sp.]|uniref:PaaI family thioesterase n=1 Tax=Thalassolituus sp. TaxID=2030822 RepID=UPI003510E06C